jgi:prepilin-type N-terminal cleavage/methylation domain-containing protein
MSRRRAFTLVELLVVVTIVVILLAPLTPALDRAMSAAEAARCGANLKGAGMALHLYLHDHRRTYPLIGHFALLMGKLGDKGYQGANAHSDRRPLNTYLGYTGREARVPIAQCPSDRGDPFVDGIVQVQPMENVYHEAGNSYIAMLKWRDPPDEGWFRIKFVFGHSGDPNRFPSARHGSFSRTQNKVILADWPVFGDRHISDPHAQWHGTDRRLFSTLFADAHVELFDYDIYEMEDAGPGGQGKTTNALEPPNPSFDWW